MGKRKKELDMRTQILNGAVRGGSMRKLSILFAAGVLVSTLAVADDDPPSRAVRLSYVAGKVSFQPQGEETDWVDADLNRALTTGDKLWVEDGGRTEFQTVNSTIRLNGHTNFSFLGVEGDTTQIQLSLGVMLIRLKNLDENETYEVDTPQVAFTLLRPGVYRIAVNEAGDTTVVTVRGGDGETTADGKAAPLHANEEVVIKGNPAVYDKHGAPRTDEFDDWAATRDKVQDASVSVTRVAPGVVGAADLDVAGAWRPAPVYGNVWFPNGLAVDWAPYRFGHWGFVPPWGWTWIDDAPWGYAPFHYGRWVSVGGVWGWAPGPVAVTAVYAPALVSFLGGVELVGVVDPVSYVALSWGEPWYPSFGVSWGYYNSVNLCGTIFAAGIIAGVWGGAAVSLAFGHDPRAVVVVGRGGFAGGHPIGREFAHRDRFGGHAFDHAHSDRAGARHIEGTRAGRMGGHEALHGRGVPPHSAMGRSAVTRHEPGRGAGGNFRGSGVNARHGASANGGHAGSFHNAANSHGGGNNNAASHNNSSASKGNNSSASKGNNSSASKGNNSSASKGNNSSASKGNNSSASKGNNSSASKGNNSSASKGSSSASKGSSTPSKGSSGTPSKSGGSGTPTKSSGSTARTSPTGGNSAPKTGGSSAAKGSSTPTKSAAPTGGAPKTGGGAPKTGGAAASHAATPASHAAPAASHAPAPRKK